MGKICTTEMSAPPAPIKRVAAYVRVSLETDRLKHSLAAQTSYFSELIRINSGWEPAGIYADSFISGTETSRRAGFQRLITDCEQGKIDIVLCKSISRFARNTVDLLETVRHLKQLGVEVRFEKENINSLSADGELLLTILASLVQEESRSISENCVWGQRKRFSDGKVTVPFSRFLGYDRGEDGNLVVNPQEAEIVREIYQMFLDGASPYAIAKRLTERGIPSPGGKDRWYKATVTSILSNEKYKGDALLQKVYTTDFLTKRKKLNEGEVPQYYVEGNHEAIISAEIFELAQSELERRRKSSAPEGSAIFMSKILCGSCGGVYTAKVWHSTNRYRRVIWQCGCECGTPHLMEEELRLVFVRAVNMLLAEREEGYVPPGAAPPEYSSALQGLEQPLAGFDESLWLALVDHITVLGRNDVRVAFRDGTEIKVEL